MYFFMNDYSEGAHPQVMKALLETNMKQTVGYGLDDFCSAAAQLIRQKTGAPQAAIHFFVGGTQANLTSLSAWLRPHQAVIAAKTGHIFVHETGAIEATGHKILTADTPDGKLTPELILPLLNQHQDEHMVQPKIVFISNATEVGTIYKLQELKDLYEFCQQHNLWLYLDGARLGTALTGRGNDVRIEDLSKVTDAFYIGGTKNGALFGEALVIVNPILQEDFRYMIKQKGGLLAKGRLLGVQYLALIQDELFFRIAAHANAMAERLQNGLKQLGFDFLNESATNQIFPIVSNQLLEQLRDIARFEVWGPHNETHSVIRFVTSWATEEAAVEEFLEIVKGLSKE